MEIFDVVNEYGEPTGNTVDRETAHLEGVRHRTSHLWLLRKKAGNTEILLQKRALTKSFPGCYDISSAGHIPAGDDFRESAIRELSEELGIMAEESDLIYCGDKYIVWDDEFFGKPYHDRQYTRVFMMWLDPDENEFTLQEEEVVDVLWLDLEKCIEGVKDNSFENCIEIDELRMVRRTAMNNIYTRVSIRKYQDKPVEKEKTEAILRAAMQAPSAANQQPWEFYIVTDKEKLEALSKVSPYAGMTKNAPVAIVSVYRKDCSLPAYANIDMSIAMENLWLETDAQGLGGVWLGIAPLEDRMKAVEGILDIPDNLRAFAIFPYGYPAEEKKQQNRFDESRIHYVG